LRHILGGYAVTTDLKREVIDLLIVSLNQAVERGMVAGLSALNEASLFMEAEVGYTSHDHGRSLFV
jgi:hypothetical protein